MRGSSRWETTPLQHTGEDGAHGGLLDRREEFDEASDRLRCVDRVHGRKHEVPGLGCLQRRLGGLGIAQLADQDDVGVLAQHAPQRLVERIGVETDLALVDDAERVLVEDLDRVLDRHDVLAPRLVDVAEDRRERRRLAGAGSAGHEDEPAVLLRQQLHAAREMKAGEVRHLPWDDAKGEGDLAALAECIHPEAREARQLVGGVQLAGLVELGDAPRCAGADLLEHAFERLGIEGRPAVERLQARRRRESGAAGRP